MENKCTKFLSGTIIHVKDELKTNVLVSHTLVFNSTSAWSIARENFVTVVMTSQSTRGTVKNYGQLGRPARHTKSLANTHRDLGRFRPLYLFARELIFKHFCAKKYFYSKLEVTAKFRLIRINLMFWYVKLVKKTRL